MCAFSKIVIKLSWVLEFAKKEIISHVNGLFTDMYYKFAPSDVL
jgi:hypothetical protein